MLNLKLRKITFPAVFRHASQVGLWTIASRIGGFFREMITAYFLGVGPVVDALVLSMKIPSFFRRITAEGTINTCFVPLFARLHAAKGLQESKRFASTVLTLFFLFLLCVTGIFLFFTPEIITFLLPGLKATPERLSMVISYGRIIFPFTVFISMTAVYGGVLNALGHFSAFSASPFFGNVFIIGVVILFLKIQNTTNFPSGKGIIFSWAILASGAVQLAIVMWEICRKKIFFGFSWPQISKPVSQFFKRLGPAVLGSGIAQINLMIGLLIASWLPSGSISYLNYADRLMQLPLSVIGTSLGITLLPALTKALHLKNIEKAHAEKELALGFTLVISALIALVLMLLSDSLVEMLFLRGKFSVHHAKNTAQALSLYALGLPGYMLVKVLSTRFFAQGNIKAPLIASGAGLLVDIVLSLLLIEKMAHLGIALASACAAWVNVAILFFLLKRYKEWQPSPVLKNIFKTLPVMFSGVWILFQVIKIFPLSYQDFWRNCFYFMAASSLIVLIFSALGRFFLLNNLKKLLRIQKKISDQENKV